MASVIALTYYYNGHFYIPNYLHNNIHFWPALIHRSLYDTRNVATMAIRIAILNTKLLQWTNFTTKCNNFVFIRGIVRSA